MNKRLLLLRHGKSSWSNSSTSDFERHLDHKGVQDSLAIGTYLKSLVKHVNLVQCSSATRTRETLENLLSAGIEIDETLYEDRLYLAGEAEIVDLISTTNPDIETLLIVGHNPWIQKIAFDLSPNEAIRTTLREGFPTCGLFQAEFSGSSWNIQAEKVTKAELITPKALAKGK